MNDQVIYHFTTVDQWEEAQDRGSYEPPEYQKDGFIHCATESQTDMVLKKHFKHHENLIKLVIDTSKLTSPLEYERAGDQQQEVPHIYGPLNIEAVAEIVFLDPITSEN